MIYPVIIHKDPDSSYGVTVPDIPGCFSAGDNFEDAITQAREAITGHVGLLLEDGQAVPQTHDIEHYADNPDYADGTWALVEVDLSGLGSPPKRINIMMPENLIKSIDQYSKAHNLSRSGFLAQAAKKELGMS